MRTVITVAFACMMAACTAPVRQTPIAGLDLADGRTLARLQQALPPDDRAALGTYALLHWPKSKFYCGKPIGGKGAVAATVGQAIDQTRSYEASLALADASARTNAALAARSEETSLITRMEQLVLERDMLFARFGARAGDTARAKEIDDELAVLRNQLAQVRG